MHAQAREHHLTDVSQRQRAVVRTLEGRHAETQTAKTTMRTLEAGSVHTRAHSGLRETCADMQMQAVNTKKAEGCRARARNRRRGNQCPASRGPAAHGGERARDKRPLKSMERRERSHVRGGSPLTEVAHATHTHIRHGAYRAAPACALTRGKMARSSMELAKRMHRNACGERCVTHAHAAS